MFGKPYAEYLRFQWPLLALTAVVGLLRLVMSISGMPDSTTKYASMTVVAFISIVYYGLRVGRTGFGTYRHLLPLIFNQAFLGNAISILGIVLSAYGMKNVYTADEFGGASFSSPMTHALGHLFIGNIVGSLIGWGLASLVMLVGGRPKKD